MKIVSVVGARPNFMKIAPIIEAISAHNNGLAGKQDNNALSIHHILVHTGQHYDDKMSDAFFNDLKIPKPDIYLGVGSASHAVQTAEIMKYFENVLLKEKPDVVIVVGDVNSTLACALVTTKISYSTNNTSHKAAPIQKKPLLAHVEAGLRSYDRSMPEEINRIITDQLSDFLFTTEESAKENLMREGISEDKIFFVGNTMIDTLMKHRKIASESTVLEKLGLKRFLNSTRGIQESKLTPYAVLTLHRPSNVDNKHTFKGILEALIEISQQMPIIFPAHPRTVGRISQFNLENYFNTSQDTIGGITTIDPLGYLDFLNLMSNAMLVLTDSGGMQEESTVLGIPCVTLRENTERPVTIKYGSNVLGGIHTKTILTQSINQLKNSKKPSQPPLWDGLAAKRIIEILTNFLH